MIKPSALLKWVISIVLIHLILLTIFRFIFFIHFRPLDYSFPTDAFVMGFRYDLRLMGILGLVILLLCALPFLHPIKNARAARFWNIFLPILFLLLLFFYVIDYFHYDYLHERLNASVLNYLGNMAISMKMVWQTYPVALILLLIIVLVTLASLFFWKLLGRLCKEPVIKAKGSRVWTLVAVLFFGVSTWGTFSQFPLRWSNVYTLGDSFKAQLALNPFQSFFSSLSFRHSTFDLEKAKKSYPLMASYLGVEHPDPAKMNFDRTIHPGISMQNKEAPNVVLVICESFSAYKSSMWGNPLNTTPYFNELCKQGILFDHCFTPSFGTARGVWATLTGIPDVEHPKTASRNPAIVEQHTLINDFTGYDKFYFIGGDANWANIRGLLDNNIKGLRVYEQEDFQAGKLNVWGISDKNLLLEANKVLSRRQRPFFAVIQTADNHRPYSIPEEDAREFKKLELPKDSIRKYGFESIEELNAFRYTDFCFARFMESAKKAPYFKNTLFVFVGDHGVAGNTDYLFPRAWQDQSLYKEHVPLLFFAPSWLTPSRQTSICSQNDILPSIAGLLSRPLTNTAMGRNLFDTALQKDRFRYSSAFINDPDEKKAGIVTDDYYFRKHMPSGTTELVPIRKGVKLPEGRMRDSLLRRLGQMTDAYYETARYLLYHNKTG